MKYQLFLSNGFKANAGEKIGTWFIKKSTKNKRLVKSRKATMLPNNLQFK